jgi:hypothetical protein
LTPELIRHILRGGQIPGVSKAMMDTLVANYLKQMVLAVQMQQQSIMSGVPFTPDKAEFVQRTLPQLSALPVEFLQQVAGGAVLPGMIIFGELINLIGVQD